MYLIATCKQGLYGHTGIHAYTLVSKVPLPLVLILANVYLQDIHESGECTELKKTKF